MSAAMKCALLAVALLCVPALAPTLAWAEVDVVKIPKGAGGVGFLPLVVMEEKKLVEQEAMKMGFKLSAEYIKFGGPSVVNDMLLSGNAHFAPAGPPAFITLWDKTAANMKGARRRGDDIDPDVSQHERAASKSLKDLTPTTRSPSPP
jgi:NitT/TauT family transport system substrate-binding protein